MNKHVLISLLICAFIYTYGQPPKAFNFQGQARNTDGTYVSNNIITVKASILTSSINGNTAYSEIHSSQTNIGGIFNLSIGNGVATIGNFSSIDWSKGSKFLKIEFDPLGGTNFILSGTTELLSVPYALYAEKSGNGDVPITLSGKGATTITGSYPNYVIESRSIINNYTTILGNNNTFVGPTFQSGLGISVEGSTITNTKPDQIITLTGKKDIDVSGQYPSFQISMKENTDMKFCTVIGTIGINSNLSIAAAATDIPVTIRGGEFLKTTTSGLNGNFTILGVPTGEYDIIVGYKMNYKQINPISSITVISGGKEIRNVGIRGNLVSDFGSPPPSLTGATLTGTNLISITGNYPITGVNYPLFIVGSTNNVSSTNYIQYGLSCSMTGVNMNCSSAGDYSNLAALNEVYIIAYSKDTDYVPSYPESLNYSRISTQGSNVIKVIKR